MSTKPKVLLYDNIHSAGTKIIEERCDLVYAQSHDETHLVDLARDVDAIIIRANGRVSKRIMDAAPRLKVIARHGVGVENIDLNIARERGIVVVYTPGANTVSVAEHFMALVFTLTRKIRPAHAALQKAYWKARYELTGTELFEKTLGVLGMGKIGQQTARICHNGFHMPVLYHDVKDYPDIEQELSARRVPIEQLFQESDIISINTALLPQTQGLVHAGLLRLMKPTSFIVNMARGPIWKEADVVRALTENWIAGAAADVFEVEPVCADNPLFVLDNFVGSPHMAAHTQESLIRMGTMIARDILKVLDGDDPDYPIPEEIYRNYE